jgi:cation diffusion facilitator CzcD-associated flavoprotein CzcO
MNLRQTNLERLAKESFDVLIIGAGINGAIAAAALSTCSPSLPATAGFSS